MKSEIIFHTAWAMLAHLSGLSVLLRAKGNRLHRLVGRVYALSMLVTLGSSFLITEMWDSFGVFHIFTIIGLITLGFGLYYPLFAKHKPGWQIAHYWWMLYSYVGLWLATFSHLGAYLRFSSWATFILIMYVFPYVVASVVIIRYDRKNRMLYSTGS